MKVLRKTLQIIVSIILCIMGKGGFPSIFAMVDNDFYPWSYIYALNYDLVFTLS
jgi:hypothetical protein